jgi:hypothetical protein
MDALPQFRIVSPKTLAEAIAARADNPNALPLGGGTDLVVNIRRGIVAPPVLIDMNRVQELHGIKADEQSIELGASVTLSEIARHAAINKHYPVVAQAAAHIAGPTHRNMGTVGGNLCLDTRCIFYNQSEWWRDANNHCLKTTGTICHVAPKSRGVCFATFSGDLAPALLTFGAEVWRSSISASPVRTRRSQRRRATANIISRCVRASSSLPCVRRTRQACARPMTKSASAARSNIRSPASPSRCGKTKASSRICASPSPAPIRARCCSPALPSSAAAGSTSASSRASTRWCATRLCR